MPVLEVTIPMLPALIVLAGTIVQSLLIGLRKWRPSASGTRCTPFSPGSARMRPGGRGLPVLAVTMAM